MIREATQASLYAAALREGDEPGLRAGIALLKKRMGLS